MVSYNLKQIITRQCIITPIEMAYFSVLEISCDIGNPFPSRGRLELSLVFQPNPDTLVGPSLVFSASVNSSNEEVSFKKADNVAILTLPVTTMADINIRG